MSATKINNKLASLSKKTPEYTVKDVKLPETSANFLDLFESNSSASCATANSWIIDTFPSQVPTMAHLMSITNDIHALVDHKNEPKLSAPTIIMYLLSLYHGFFLLNDMFVRPSTSTHAQLWLDSSARKEFAEFLLSLPVPTSMEAIFAQLVVTTTDRTSNVFFVPSAAGFSLRHFYGRFFPVTIFSAIHDITATLQSNAPASDVYDALLKHKIFTATNGTDTFTSYLGDYFGFDIHDATPLFLNGKFHQFFTSLFNPVLFRDYQRRSAMATLNLSAPKFQSIDPNAYDTLFGYTAANIKELKIVLQSVSKHIFDKIPANKNLGTIISTGSGNSILQHGYSEFAVPTWYVNNGSVSNATLRRPGPYSHHERSQRMTFLTPGTLPTATHSTAFFTYSATRTTGATFSAIWPFSLVMPAPSATVHYPTINDFETITDENEMQYAYPRCLVLDISGSSTVDAHLATLTGKIIETYSLDGCTIEMPNIWKSLGMQNCIFSDSLIPYSRVVYSTRMTAPPATKPLPRVLSRTKANSTTALPASSLLHDRTRIVLPHIQKTIRDPLVANSSPAMETLPGMTRVDNVNWISAVQSFLGFRTAISENSTTDRIPGMTDHLFVWSPYSYTSFNQEQDVYNTTTHVDDRRYFLTNLRSIFGTDYNLTMVNHPLDAMPAL